VKIILPKLLVLIIVPMGMAMAQTQTINFDNFKAGDPPAGWTATKTGSGQPKWTIERDDTAPDKLHIRYALKTTRTSRTVLWK
jgi:hypothetical protein